MPTQARTATPIDGARQCIGHQVGGVALNSTADMDNNRIAGDCSTLQWPLLRRQLRLQRLHSTRADTRADALAY